MRIYPPAELVPAPERIVAVPVSPPLVHSEVEAESGPPWQVVSGADAVDFNHPPPESGDAPPPLPEGFGAFA